MVQRSQLVGCGKCGVRHDGVLEGLELRYSCDNSQFAGFDRLLVQDTVGTSQGPMETASCSCCCRLLPDTVGSLKVDNESWILGGTSSIVEEKVEVIELIAFVEVDSTRRLVWIELFRAWSVDNSGKVLDGTVHGEVILHSGK